MFCGEDGEDYNSSYSFNLEPKVEVKGETVEPVQSVSTISIEPPSAEKMLRKLRSKLAGKGLKEI